MSKLSIAQQIIRSGQRRYPNEVLRSSGGKRVIAQDFWNHGHLKNIPQHYRDYHETWRQGPTEHIHSIPNKATFEKDEWGEIYPVQNPRIYVVYPDQFHKGLWGGEGVIKGMLKRPDGNHRNFTPPGAKYWWPRLFEGVVHSEILDAYIDVVCTKRGVKLVDESGGFDYYLLKTPVNEIYATGMLRLKRELLLALANKDNFSTKLGGKPDVYEKYQRFAVSYEEADWHGLTFPEALRKQARLETIAAAESVMPDKHKFRAELVEMLRSGKADDLEMVELEADSPDSSWIENRLSGIKRILK